MFFKLITSACRDKDGYGSIGAISRALVDVSAERSGDRKDGDASYVAHNDKASDLWRPGNGFRPTSFIDTKGPKVSACPLHASSGTARHCSFFT